MKGLCLCILSVLAAPSVSSAQNTDTDHIRVFPAANRTVAGVFQVSHLNNFNQPQYAFNASEARRMCSSLGVHIASKSQVEMALRRGFETCRFGWIDEHFAVIPRVQALTNCGKNQTGLVPWRASVTKKFDVFCFSESDAATQWKDAAPDSSSPEPGLTQSPSVSSIFSSTSAVMDEAPPTPFMSSSQLQAGGKVILISCTCVILLIAMVILAYLKLRRCVRSSDEKQPEYIETEEWMVVTKSKDTQKEVNTQKKAGGENEAQKQQ